MTFKRLATIVLSVALLFSAAAGVFFAVKGGSTVYADSYADAFDFSDGEKQMKYKTGYSGSNGRGLLLYSYASGAEAKFKSVLNGDFEAEFDLPKSGAKSDLKKISFVLSYADAEFKITLAYGEEGYCNVEYGGNKAGLVYCSDGKLYNYTALYNRDGKYTEFNPNGTTKIKFDFLGKKVYVSGNGESQLLVWDFQNITNDGKTLENDLSSMGEYRVSVLFDEVKPSSKGQLLLYKFAGISLDKTFVDSACVLKADYSVKAIVGEAYALAEGKVKNVLTDELQTNETVTVNVYNEKGEEVAVTNNSFMPSEKGNYYVWYSARNGELTSFYKVEAVNESEIVAEYVADKTLTAGSFGVNSVVYVPVMTANSNYAINNSEKATVLTVKKDGKTLKGYENVSGGFDFVLDRAGEYEFNYSVPEWNGRFAESIVITADESLVGKVIEDMPKEVAVGEKIQIQPAKFYKNGNEETAEVFVIEPDGTVTKGSTFAPAAIGVYKIEHRWSGGTERFSVTVKNKYSDLFSVGKNSSVSYGTMEGNNTVKGQLLSLANNSKVVYNKVIDLGANNFDDTLADRLQNKPLLEFIPQPKTAGRSDLTGLYVVLTDKYDEENTVTIRFKYMDYNPNMILLRTKAQGQGYAGYYYDGYGNMEVHNAQSHEDGGFIIQSSFAQNLNAGHDMLEDSVKIYYNNDLSTLYAEPWDWSKPVMKSWAVRNYSSADRVYGCGDTPWRGFKTGEVYMTIYAMGVESTADIMVTKIGGESVEDMFVSDNDAPAITVDVDENDVPFGQTEKKYKVFGYTAKDLYSTVISDGVTVTFNGKEIPVENGYFTPQTAGEYMLNYYATDSYGNRANKTIKVTVKQSVAAPAIEINGELPAKAVKGQKITLPEIITDEAGVTTGIEVYCGGELIDVEYGSFVCKQEDVYMVKFIATNHIGIQKTEIKYIIVSLGDAPVFDEDQIVLPAAFVEGETYQFGDYSAYLYTQSGKSAVKAKIVVTDGQGETTLTNGLYTPKAFEDGSLATIKFIFEKGSKKTIAERSVPVKKISQKMGFLKEYFIAEGGTLTATDEGVIVSFDKSEGKKSFEFIRPIDQSNFSVSLLTKTEKCGYSSFIFTLRSATDYSKKVKLYVEKRAEYYYGSLDGKNYTIINYNSKEELVIAYSESDKAIVDCYGSVIALIENNSDGSLFDGFGGNIYFDVELIDMSTESDIGVSLIANQGFNNNRNDRNAPLITTEFGLSGNYVKGDKVTVPAAKAYDVLTNATAVTLTITANGKTLAKDLSCDKSMEYTLSELGEYAFIYESKDSRGNITRMSLFLSVSDLTKPKLNFKGGIPEKVSVGSVITLPEYEVSVKSATVKVYYSAPDSIMREMTTNKLTFNRAGKYKIFYIADDGGNVTTYSFTVMAE